MCDILEGKQPDLPDKTEADDDEGLIIKNADLSEFPAGAIKPAKSKTSKAGSGDGSE
jgi:hypothetical protein